MGLPEIVDVARNFSAMIRVQGPDPKGLKMRKHAFHHYISGRTTLSASGMVLPSYFKIGPLIKQASNEPMSLVLTVASIIEPFLSSKHRDNISQAKPELISGVQIDIMVEGNAKASDNEARHWLPAEFITLVDISASSVALESLIGSSFGSEHGWEVGWSLASYNESQQSKVKNLGEIIGAESINSSLMGKLATQIAILKVSSRNFEDLPNLNISPTNKRGDLLLAMGSPFGVLSPLHFCNSISVGSVANCYPPNSSQASLLMADIRCLPGMEGSPVFGEHSDIVGMLTRPLRQRGSGAEVQLVIPWTTILKACDGFLLPNTIDTKNSFTCIHEYPNSHGLLEKAMASICLITIDDGVWASGVLLNNHGLILTNAHLLEPWRFKKTDEHLSNLIFPRLNQTKLRKKSRNFDVSYKFKSGNRSIRVRVDHLDRWIWCDAKVIYVSNGPLDVALLKLEFAACEELQPIVMDFACPSPGSKAYVVGHGLFGPRSDVLPSACVGVVAKVVKARRSGHVDFPAMIETTAAVHPGGSGGAVFNSKGQMISLVTSNARHGGGTVIPHLNFSIPCAALQPVFNFSKDMEDLSLLEYLDKPNEHLSSVWALMPPTSPKPGPGLPDPLPMLPGDGKNDTKGSRFAKFIAERQELFKKTSHVGNIPSKL